MANHFFHFTEATHVPRGCAVPFLFVWLCGWAAGEVMLVATLFGADMPWANREVPPLWSLIILTAFWSTAGAYAMWIFLRAVLRR